MSNLESLTMFTTGVRVTILLFLITSLYSTIRKSSKIVGSALSPIGNNPRVLLYAVCCLLITSLVEVGLEMYDHWKHAQ